MVVDGAVAPVPPSDFDIAKRIKRWSRGGLGWHVRGRLGVVMPQELVRRAKPGACAHPSPVSRLGSVGYVHRRCGGGSTSTSCALGLRKTGSAWQCVLDGRVRRQRRFFTSPLYGCVRCVRVHCRGARVPAPLARAHTFSRTAHVWSCGARRLLRFPPQLHLLPQFAILPFIIFF